MNKLESLKLLLQVVQNNELAKGNYCSEDGKNCVIGHLLKIGGMTEEQLRIMDGKEEVPNSYDNWYSISSIISYLNKEDIKDDIVDKTLNELGFNIRTDDRKILDKLQGINDSKGKGKEELEQELKYIISRVSEFELEENQNEN